MSRARGRNTARKPEPVEDVKPGSPEGRELGLSDRVLRSAAPHKITVPGTGSDPVRLCGVDAGRTEVMILNESTAQDIRIAQRLPDLTNGGGALVPYPSNSYVTIKTQDELWGLSTSATAATISVIQVFERGE